MRLEKRAAKQAQTSEPTPSASTSPKKCHKNEEKTLEMLLNEVPENSHHKLKVS